MSAGTPAWRVSGYCDGGACIEVASAWRKASWSMNNGNCVEVASGPAVMVRDTADRGGTVLEFPASAWREFTGQVRRG